MAKRGRKSGSGRSELAVNYVLEHGCTLRDAAEVFGISHQAIQQRWKARGLGLTPFDAATEQRKQELRIVADGTKTASQLAEDLGWSHTTIYNTAKSIGVRLKPSRKRYDEQSLAAAFQALSHGVRIAEAARLVGISYGHFVRLMRDHGKRSSTADYICGLRERRAEAASKIVDEEGVSLTEAAKRVGVSAVAVRSWRIRRGLPIRRTA